MNGITPAHAGKSSQKPYVLPFERDHPRTCGEKPKAFPAFIRFRGSPPHMRGKGTAVKVLQLALGITPAHAGKRSRAIARSLYPEDHPRTCGEK